jgi:hypothetical protein
MLSFHILSIVLFREKSVNPYFKKRPAPPANRDRGSTGQNPGNPEGLSVLHKDARAGKESLQLFADAAIIERESPVILAG